MLKKITILILICFLFKTVNSQVWCTPNSLWHFTHNNTWHKGYKKWNYVFDTVVAGETCNKIIENTVAFTPLPPYNVNFTSFIYTYTKNKVVYIKNVLQPGFSSFDTLFDFNAAIGSKWRMAPISQTGCAVSFVVVLDTGRNTIQGQSLKWLKVKYKNNAPPFNFEVNDTIYERFGTLNVFPYNPHNICPWVTDSESGGPLRCFSDNQIINYKHNWPNSCIYYLTSLKELKMDDFLKVFPNPANEIINFELEDKSENYNLKLVNILGKEVVNIPQILNTNTQLNLKSIEKGIYFLQIYNNGDLICTKKIIKE